MVSMATSSVCNLRLSSRTVALFSSPERLPQAFWASRFAPDNEMAFAYHAVLDQLSHPRVDWHDMYFRIRNTLEDKSEGGQMRNRRRIWHSLGHLTRCLVPLLEQDMYLLDEDDLHAALSFQGYQAGQLIQGIARQDKDLRYNTGMRLFGAQYISFRHGETDQIPISLAISFLEFDCIKYVCGMRFLAGKGRSWVELSRAGLIHPTSETRISILPEERLVGIRVATSVCGIVGLSLLVQNSASAGQELSRAAGEIMNPSDGVGVGILRPQMGDNYQESF